MSWLRSPMFRLPLRSPMDIRRSKRQLPLFPPGAGAKMARAAPGPGRRGAPRPVRPLATPPAGPPGDAPKA
jgi:hypothetical protein